MERRITHVTFNSLLYLHVLQMKYVIVYMDLIRYLYICIDAIHILSTGSFLAFVNYFDNWTYSFIPNINLDINEDEPTFLQDHTPNTSKLIGKLTQLKDLLFN